MTSKDYTWLPVGTRIDGGEIEECSHCGRRGLLENIRGELVFTHTTAVGFKNGPTLDWDICP